MASLDVGTGLSIVVIAIIVISIFYALIRWWRWHRQ